MSQKTVVNAFEVSENRTTHFNVFVLHTSCQEGMTTAALCGCKRCYCLRFQELRLMSDASICQTASVV
jgi:hypothetical protein